MGGGQPREVPQREDLSAGDHGRRNPRRQDLVEAPTTRALAPPGHTNTPELPRELGQVLATVDILVRKIRSLIGKTKLSQRKPAVANAIRQQEK